MLSEIITRARDHDRAEPAGDLRPQLRCGAGWLAKRTRTWSRLSHRARAAGRIGAGGAVLLFAAARELLRNVAHHAGVASVTIRVAGAPDRIELEVRDEGSASIRARSPTPRATEARPVRNRRARARLRWLAVHRLQARRWHARAPGAPARSRRACPSACSLRRPCPQEHVEAESCRVAERDRQLTWGDRPRCTPRARRIATIPAADRTRTRIRRCRARASETTLMALSSGAICSANSVPTDYRRHRPRRR